MALHEILLERSTLHGHFSRDLQPILGHLRLSQLGLA